MAINKKVSLKIITPDGTFWNKPVDIVTLKTTEGYIGLQHGKSPFVASLDIAELTINKKGSNEYKDCAIAGGIVIASKEKVEIITDAIEFKGDIDVKRAQKAKNLAEKAIQTKRSEAEYMNASLALKRALNRIQIKQTLQDKKK